MEASTKDLRLHNPAFVIWCERDDRPYRHIRDLDFQVFRP